MTEQRHESLHPHQAISFSWMFLLSQSLRRKGANRVHHFPHWRASCAAVSISVSMHGCFQSPQIHEGKKREGCPLGKQPILSMQFTLSCLSLPKPPFFWYFYSFPPLLIPLSLSFPQPLLTPSLTLLNWQSLPAPYLPHQNNRCLMPRFPRLGSCSLRQAILRLSVSCDV